MKGVSVLCLICSLLVFARCFEAPEWRSERLVYPIYADGKWGGIDKNGNIQISPQYDWLYYDRFGLNRLLVEKDSLKKLIDYQGNLLLDSIDYDVIVLIKESKIELIDTQERDTFFYAFEPKSTTGKKMSKNCLEVKEVESGYEIQGGRSEKFGVFKNVSRIFNSELIFVVGEDFYGYMNCQGDMIWSYKVPDLSLVWMDYDLITSDSSHLKNSHDYAYSLYRNKLVFLMRDLSSDSNLDFNFDRYQIPFIL